ncbi:hypothetical protein RIF29_16400 [Crotalaria pallida]|uniref:Uncharacterized protein n=1 Tax=Crotalaria pallida TaxID=3830 RepID=A0AAN9IC02_CROPI
MTTLHKFKLLAMHCGGSQSPNRSSPRASPLVPLRRRKTTLRMLLGRSQRRRLPVLQRERLSDKKKMKGGDRVRRHSLKDLFGSSSPPGQESNPNCSYNYNYYNYNNMKEDEIHRSISNAGLSGSGYGNGSPRPGWRMGFRCRSLLSLRKAWRPVLLTIAE